MYTIKNCTNFRILIQVVVEKSLTEKCPYVKFEKEGTMRILIFNLHDTLCLPEGVHKI